MSYEKHISQEQARNMYEALKTIAYVRDYNAEHGTYPEGYLGEDQEFDDWASDVASQAILGV